MRPTRDPLADKHASRGVELRRLLRGRVTERRRDLEGVHPERLLDHASNTGRQRAGEQLRHARLQPLLLSQLGGARRPEIGALRVSDVAE